MNDTKTSPLTNLELVEINGGSQEAFDAGVSAGEALGKFFHMAVLLAFLW